MCPLPRTRRRNAGCLTRIRPDDVETKAHLARSCQGPRHVLACDGASDAHDGLATGRGPPGKETEAQRCAVTHPELQERRAGTASVPRPRLFPPGLSAVPAQWKPSPQPAGHVSVKTGTLLRTQGGRSIEEAPGNRDSPWRPGRKGYHTDPCLPNE